MAPQAFLEKSLATIQKRNSDYRPVAGLVVTDPGAGFLAILYQGHNNDTFKRDLVLHVADDNPKNNEFEEVTLRAGQIDPGEQTILVDGLELAVFRGVGSLTLEEPFRSV